MEPQLLCCGNIEAQRLVHLPLLASMEPQLLCCGNTKTTTGGNDNNMSFNGATTFVLWKLHHLQRQEL